MSHFLRFLKRNPRIRASALAVGTSALSYSAEAADFGFVSLNNAQGASEAIAELSQQLDGTLNDFDFDGLLSSGRQLLETRLDEEARKYANSSLNDSICRQKWSCSQSEAQLISMAMNCAASVYDRQSLPNVEGLELKELEYIPHSGSGTIKATALTLIQETALQEPANPLLPTLVVAIKGSKSVVDWMVNLNNQTCDATNLFDPTALGASGGTKSISIHAGFLNGATALLKILTKSLKALLGADSIHHVLLTGHSSGGAVASLVFTKLLSIAATEYPSIKFSLITFGAPPVATPDLTPILKAQPAELRGMVLSFVNEYDLVPRSDTDYIRSLVDLYRSYFNLGPVAEHGKTANAHAPATAVISNQSIPLRKPNNEDALPIWQLSAPHLEIVGDIVVLKDSNPNGEEVQLSAALVHPSDFATLLFVRASVHSRAIYLDNIERIKSGNLNGKDGW